MQAKGSGSAPKREAHAIAMPGNAVRSDEILGTQDLASEVPATSHNASA
jgi:hypothetical protein